MRAYFLALLLIITLDKSCCEDISISEEGQGDDSLAGYQNEMVSYKKLMKNVIEDMSCNERKEKAIPLKNRDDLEADKRTLRIKTPAEFVVVRGSEEHCSSEKECVKLLQLMKKRASLKGCHLEDNFYIGGDGYAYEGRGWDVAPYWNLNGLRSKSITVQFFGDYTKTTPHHRVMEAFRTTMKIGEWSGKISKGYKITSMRELFNDSFYLGKKLDEHLATWENWANAKYMSSLWNYTIPTRLTFVFRDQWNALEPKTSSALARPAAHIVISDGGQRCINRSQCSIWMRTEQIKYIKDYGDLFDNFYIGEEGEVFEGRGWDTAPHWYLPELKKDLLSIHLIGSHELQLPSEKAINSLKQLVQTGVWLGKVSQDYQLFSLRHVYSDRNLTGENLHREVEGWISRWEPGRIKHARGERILSPFVKTSSWSADMVARQDTVIAKAVDYVIVYDGGDRCFNHVECTASLEKERRKDTLIRDLPDNFYIGEDGMIYEERGWTRLPEWRSVFVGTAFVTVKFMGSFQEYEPTWLGWSAFNTLIKTGIDAGRISPNYRLITLRQTHSSGLTKLNETSWANLLPHNRLESRLKEMASWSNSITRGKNSSIPMYRNLIFPRTTWILRPILQYPVLRQPIGYVVVESIEQHCPSRDSCIRTMKERYDQRVRMGYEGISYNFYIGGDGWVFEGRGWDGASQLNIQGSKHNFLFVTFLRDFQSIFPSSLATYGFDHLMLTGVNAGILALDYKILSIHQIFPNRTGGVPNNVLLKDIKTWDRWSENVPYSDGKGDSPSGKDIFVSSRNWSNADWKPALSTANRIVRRILVLNVGSRCFTHENCSMIMRAEQKSSLQTHGYVTENFYIGEDGHVYEGRGWNSPAARNSVLKSVDAITVAFLGNFEKNAPAPEALFAFQYLMKWGTYLNHIGDFYRIESLKGSCDPGVSLGEALDQEIRSWEMWGPSSVNDCSGQQS